MTAVRVVSPIRWPVWRVAQPQMKVRHWIRGCSGCGAWHDKTSQSIVVSLCYLFLFRFEDGSSSRSIPSQTLRTSAATPTSSSSTTTIGM